MARGRIYNKFYTDELWEQVNKDNKAILSDFLAEYKQRKKSPKTIAAYFQNLRIVFIYILKELDNKCILELSRKDFRGLSLYMTETCGMSPARANSIKSACNSMLTFCEEDDDYEYEINQSKKVKGVPRERVKDNDDNFFFTFDEFIKVRDILVERGKLQSAVLWSIAFDSAGRRNEIFQIQKHGLTSRNKTNIVVGKRGKKFPLVYLNDTRELIKRYLDERGEDDIDSLWIKGSGDHKQEVKPETLYDRIIAINEILSEVRGEKCEIFFHSIRHSRLECLAQGTDTRLLDADGKPIKYPLEKIQILAHHSSSDVTQMYLKNHDDEEIDAMFNLGDDEVEQDNQSEI